MTPFDGSGYGCSDYWHYSARRLAHENSEYCSCWNTEPFFLKFIDQDFHVSIKCREKKGTCVNSFAETEKRIQELYKKFYSINR